MGFTYWVRSCAAVLAFSALIGCGNDDRQVVSSNETVDWSKVKLVLGDQAKGLRTVVEASKAFDGVPYQVEWANFQGAAPLFEALRAGAVDLAPAGDTPVLAAATGGAPLRIVAVRRSQARSIAILVPKDSPIQTVADLKGRNVVISSARGSISQYLLIRALANAGVKETDVNIGFVMPTDALPAFNAGKIEAWATFGVYQAFAEEQGARVLLSGEGINTGLTFTTASDEVLTDPVRRQAINDVLKRLPRRWTGHATTPISTPRSLPGSTTFRCRCRVDCRAGASKHWNRSRIATSTPCSRSMICSSRRKSFLMAARLQSWWTGRHSRRTGISPCDDASRLLLV